MSRAIPRTMLSRAESAQLDHLADEVRGAVVRAVKADDLDSKVRWWKSYRDARRAALSMLHDDGADVLEAAHG